MSRVMGLDYGRKRAGVAISDETKRFARALKILRADDPKRLLDNIKDIVDEYDIDHIVIGLCKRADGSLGEIGQEIISFADKIKEELDIKVDLYEEAMTTREVTDRLIEMGKSRKKYKKELDKFSAEIILQEYLNKLRIKN